MDHHFPAEWELHQRIWLSWPSPDDESPAHQQPSRSFAIRELLATLINHSVPVSLVVQDSVDQASVLSYLSNTLPSSLLETYLSFIHIPHDDIWMRDFGPIFVIAPSKDGKSTRLKVVDFPWTIWGYQWNIKPGVIDKRDGRIGRKIAEHLSLDVIESEIASEGGDREFNGRGTLIVCEAVELQRNPGKTKEFIESEFKRLFNVKKIIWMKKGLADDEQSFRGPFQSSLGRPVFTCQATGGHTDEFVRFVGPKTILLGQVITEETKDPIGAISHQHLEENFAILKNETDQDGNSFEIIRIPMPPPLYIQAQPGTALYEYYEDLEFIDKSVVLDGKTPLDLVIASSYCNFLITNGVVIAAKYYKEGRSPVYKSLDEQAKTILQQAFPDREVVQLDVECINATGGGIHCITQQQPIQ